MTTATYASHGRAASPVGNAFARSLGLALAVGLVPAVAFFIIGGPDSGLSALFGLVVAGVAFGCSLALMAGPLRRAHPQIMFLAALTLYAVQIVALLLVFDLSSGIAWLDGVAVGITILVVALVWQATQMIAWRRARTLVFDEERGPRE